MVGKYLKYKLKAHYWHGHHVHSPYTYWIMTNVIYERWPYYSFEKIESLRKKSPSSERGELEAKYCQLMQRFCATNNAKRIVQIGSGEGWETMYLASNDSRAEVAIEGKLSKGARNRLQLLGIHNVHEGRVDGEGIDMAVCTTGEIRDVFDRYAGKMRDCGIMIFSKIHERDEEWEYVVKDNRVRISMDLFKIGVCLMRSEMQKEHYIVKF